MYINLPNMKLTLDTDAVIAKFGGVCEMARFCTQNGMPITKQGVSRWKQAQTIPMGAWINLVSMTAVDGKPTLDLRKYLVRA